MSTVQQGRSEDELTFIPGTTLGALQLSSYLIVLPCEETAIRLNLLSRRNEVFEKFSNSLRLQGY